MAIGLGNKILVTQKLQNQMVLHISTLASVLNNFMFIF